jgi:hypothetical protein
VIVCNGSHLVVIMQGDESRKRLPPDGSECSDVEVASNSDADEVARPFEEVFMNDLDEFRLEKEDMQNGPDHHSDSVATHSESDAEDAMEEAQSGDDVCSTVDDIPNQTRLESAQSSRGRRHRVD